VKPSDSELQAPLCTLPGFDLFKIRLVPSAGLPYGIEIGLDRRQVRSSVKILHDLVDMVYGTRHRRREQSSREARE